MRQYEAVVRVMEQNGGYATLAHLYEHVLDVPGCDWRTRTPFASIRRIVQVHTDLFFKVRPGLWALSTWKERLPAGMQPTKKQSAECEEFSHSYYQGLIIHLGNLKNFETHVSPQDRNRVFLGKDTLGDLASLREMHAFTYSHLVSRARTIDVAWFNERRMPDVATGFESDGGLLTIGHQCKAVGRIFKSRSTAHPANRQILLRRRDVRTPPHGPGRLNKSPRRR